MNKRQQAKALTRDKVLSAARRVFVTEGYENATIRLIAKTAGVSTGAVFNSFTGKEDLWRAATGLPTPDDWARQALAGLRLAKAA